MFCAFLGHTGERLQDRWSSGFDSEIVRSLLAYFGKTRSEIGYSENKGADQLHGYGAADLHLCFRICRSKFSHEAARIIFQKNI